MLRLGYPKVIIVMEEVLMCVNYKLVPENRLEISKIRRPYLLIAIRLDGFLWDYLLLRGNNNYVYPFPVAFLATDFDISVEEIIDDMDMTLPINKTYKQVDFFKKLALKRKHC